MTFKFSRHRFIFKFITFALLLLLPLCFGIASIHLRLVLPVLAQVITTTTPTAPRPKEKYFQLPCGTTSNIFRPDEIAVISSIVQTEPTRTVNNVACAQMIIGPNVTVRRILYHTPGAL